MCVCVWGGGGGGGGHNTRGTNGPVAHLRLCSEQDYGNNFKDKNNGYGSPHSSKSLWSLYPIVFD